MHRPQKRFEFKTVYSSSLALAFLYLNFTESCRVWVSVYSLDLQAFQNLIWDNCMCEPAHRAGLQVIICV